MDKPAFFESVRQAASDRWDQLEQDRELAGPWHQLFLQVQSPRHVVSELLQNADDAGATEASVRIRDAEFIFEHDGSDFTEDQFASLCGFGYSNKRALHTIVFRGMGFKSTFSLGDPVELHTPSLSIAFDRYRFTEPHWLVDDVDTDRLTRVSVKCSDTHRQDEVARNLEEWLKNPFSLLFFKSLRQLRVGDQTLSWRHVRPGPVDDSEWVKLDGSDREEVLLLRSAAEAFPEESLIELREEHLLGEEEPADFPPCSVELALGAKGHLYSVLPMGVDTALPFACNAPFIPDPARIKIKDPGASPTNRWLLARAGELAAQGMLAWLNRQSLPESERARAYDLVPDVDSKDVSPAGVCGKLVEEAFDRGVSGAGLLLTDAGEIVRAREAVILPRLLQAVWPTEQIAALLDDTKRPAVSASVSSANVTKLHRKRLADEISKSAVLWQLQAVSPPKPATWGRLLQLWAYFAPDITGYQHLTYASALRIVPANGDDVLSDASHIVRLSKERQLSSDEDSDFLTSRLRVIDRGWTKYLEDGQTTTADTPPATQKLFLGAMAVLKAMALDTATRVHVLIGRVADQLPASGEGSLAAHVRLAQIAAKLAVSVTKSFPYVTIDGAHRTADLGVVWDRLRTLSPLLPDGWRIGHVLHGDYSKVFASCTREEWNAWAGSSR